MVFYHHFTLLMDRSPGFGSTSCNSVALLRLGLPSAPYLLVLNLAAQRNSPVRSTKSTRSHLVRALSACKHRVSGSLSLPSRGSFHLSLTVLCAIGHRSFLGLGGGPPGFPQNFTCSAVLWCRLSVSRFRYRTVTVSGPAFLRCSRRVLLLFDDPQPRASADSRFGLFPLRSPLLRESSFLSSPPGT